MARKLAFWFLVGVVLGHILEYVRFKMQASVLIADIERQLSYDG